MPNPKQNQVQNEIEQFKREINLLQDMLKQSLKKNKVYCKMDKRELQKCIIKYRMKQSKLKGR